MQLYNVSFTTNKMVVRYNERGKPVGETVMNDRITMTMLPYVTAMKYKGCDNFEIEPYQFQDKAKKVSKKHGIGNGTRGVGRHYAASSDPGVESERAVKKPAKTGAQRAAESGNMAEAIND